jgi:hypothetical protein
MHLLGPWMDRTCQTTSIHHQTSTGNRGFPSKIAATLLNILQAKTADQVSLRSVWADASGVQTCKAPMMERAALAP